MFWWKKMYVNTHHKVYVNHLQEMLKYLHFFKQKFLLTCLFVVAVSSFYSYHEKAWWRSILDESAPAYRSYIFPSFPVISLTSYHLIYSLFESLSRDNLCKASYPRTQQRVRRGWELKLDHAIVITRSP